MNRKNLLPLLLFLFGVDLSLGIDSKFLETVRNSSLLHHKETNTVWEYLGTYAQPENTINYILEVPVFQFMCDVFPASMAFAMQACTQYRSRILGGGSARRLNELFDAHVRKQNKRQIGQIAIVGAAAYGAYKIIGDLFGGKNDEIIHRLDESENFQKHQEKLDDVLVTSILSLENDNLVMLQSFKSLFDSVNTTRSLIHSLLKLSIREQKTFTGWAKFSLKSEMRRHYEQFVSAFTRVANLDLNLEMFSPEQRTYLHDCVWNRVRSNLPSNFSASLAQFVPNLLTQQLISFKDINESEIVYELNEDDFNFVIESDSHDAVAQNETIELDSILPKIVGHARIQNFFGIPTNFSSKKMQLYKITRLPLFIDERKALYTASLPQYLALADDGSSSEWLDFANRRCTIDEKSKYMFCSVPVPVFSSIQDRCLRSIVLNASMKDCLKETVDLSSPHVVKFAHNIHAISVHTPLQCFEKGDKENRNLFSNITKVAIIKTRCNSFISCGTLDFSSFGGVCDRVESYILTFNKTYENPFILDKSINPVGVEIDNLSHILDIPSLIESVLSHKKHLEEAHIEFESNIHRTIKTKVWPKVLIGIFLVILTVAVCTILFASRLCFNQMHLIINWQKIFDYLFPIRSKKKSCQVDESFLDTNVHRSMSAHHNSCYDFIHRDKTNIDQFQPFFSRVDSNGSIQCPLYSNYTVKGTSSLNSDVAFNLPLSAPGISTPIHSPHMLSAKTICRKPDPLPRKKYRHTREYSDPTLNHTSIASGEFFEEDRE